MRAVKIAGPLKIKHYANEVALGEKTYIKRGTVGLIRSKGCKGTKLPKLKFWKKSLPHPLFLQPTKNGQGLSPGRYNHLSSLIAFNLSVL